MTSFDHPHEPVAIRDRPTLVTCAVLLVLTAAAWVLVVSSSTGADHHGAMDALPPSVTAGLAFVVSWAVMMAAMMLPSALPMIALYGALQRKAADRSTRGVPVAAQSVR